MGSISRQIEAGGDLDETVFEGMDSVSARAVAKEMLETYASDAQALPLDALVARLDGARPAPLELAAEFSVDLATVLRRLAFLPQGALARPTGLVMCDASGSIVFYKPAPGFALPRYGEGCPLWPVFSALNRPLVPIRRRIVQLGRSAAEFECHAIAWPQPARLRSEKSRSIAR